ncbi:hypothetical protein GBAR_LOCUS13935, partial [Geodia barretti]
MCVISGAVNETKVLGCGLISWKPPPGNEGLKLSYIVRFFDGGTYETSASGYRRIQRNIEIGRQWTRVNNIPDGRTVYADIPLYVLTAVLPLYHVLVCLL